MVNILLASLVSVCLGFLAGSFFGGGEDIPTSAKAEVAGRPDAVANAAGADSRAESSGAKNSQPQLGNAESGLTKSPPLKCEAGTTLQDQLARMKFLELRRLCDDAEQDWIARNVETYAPKPKTQQDHENNLRGVWDAVREGLESTTYWRGMTSVTAGDRTVVVEAFLKFYHPKDTESVHLPIRNPSEFCYLIQPVFTVNNKVQGMGGVSDCSPALQKKGDAFYFQWNTYSDVEIAPVMMVLLFPLPGAASGGLEYLASEGGKWVTLGDFRWNPSTKQENDDLHDRYSKKLETKPQ